MVTWWRLSSHRWVGGGHPCGTVLVVMVAVLLELPALALPLVAPPCTLLL